MAQWRIDTQGYDQPTVTRFETVMQADEYGRIITPGATAYSAFGEPIAIELSPVLQLDGIYGLDTRQFETYDFGNGTVSSDPIMTCTTAGDNNSYGVIRSRRAVRYRPGQGAMCRFTAMFTNPQDGYIQRAGFFTQENALQVGYENGVFGIVRETGGKAHIEKLELTGTPTAGTVSITLYDSLPATPLIVEVTIPATPTLNTAARAIAQTSFPGWIVEYSGNTVCFLSRRLGPQGGSVSITNGTGTLAGNFSTAQAGVTQTTYFIPSTDFNLDKLDGTSSPQNPSGMLIDPSKLNVYQINFRWLGAGEMRFAVENPNNGDMIFFHHIHYSNAYTLPHILNPSLKIGYVAANIDSAKSGQIVSTAGASMMGAIEGKIQTTELPSSISMSRSSNMASNNTYYHLISIRNRIIFNNKINSREIILKTISTAVNTTATNPIRIIVFYNEDTSAAAFQSLGSESTVYYSTDNYTITPSVVELFSYTVLDQADRELDNLRIVIPPGNEISVFAIAPSGISAITSSLTWIED